MFTNKMFTVDKIIKTKAIDFEAVAKAAMAATKLVADPEELSTGVSYCKTWESAYPDFKEFTIKLVKFMATICYRLDKSSAVFYDVCCQEDMLIQQAGGWKYGPEYNEHKKTNNTILSYNQLTANQQLQVRVFCDFVWEVIRSLPLEVFPELKP